MLADQLDKIDENLLNQVCTEHWDETPTLEFKAVLPQPAPDDKPKQEFLKDVAALANAGGGDIVYGISEINGKANALLPIKEAAHPVDATRRRLGQWLESGVEPRISGTELYPVRLASGDYILVVRVPASFQRPHRSKAGAHWQWPVRSGTHTADLTYPQLRDAFDRDATLGERARRFRDERLTSVIAGTTGPSRRHWLHSNIPHGLPRGRTICWIDDPSAIDQQPSCCRPRSRIYS
jgi:Putative DNA-binding domain